MRPPKGALCDLAVGWHRDSRGAPVIEKCREPATRVIEQGGFPRDVWVCEKHKDWKPSTTFERSLADRRDRW